MYPIHMAFPKYIPNIRSGTVSKVYDGDTITIYSKIPYLFRSPYYSFSIRLARIDCPEIKSTDEEEKTSAMFVRDELSDILLNNKVKLKVIDTDKYGRLLCEVYFKNVNINDWLLDNHYAVPYDGNTKHPPDSWKAYMSSARPKRFVATPRFCFF